MTDTQTVAPLRAGNKAGREAIARILIAIGELHGATVERKDEPRHAGYHSGEIDLTFTLGGVGANIGVSDLHERHGSQGAMISWYNHRELSAPTTERPLGDWLTPSRKFSGVFTLAVKAYSTWPGPHHKATTVGDWQRLADCLDAGLRCAAEGCAFLPIDSEAGRAA